MMWLAVIILKAAIAVVLTNNHEREKPNSFQMEAIFELISIERQH